MEPVRSNGSAPHRTRGEVIFALNGALCRVAGEEAFLTLTDWLRDRRRLTGTKVVCAEGDCGACTVLLGREEPDGGVRFQAVNACILFVYQLDGAFVVTVEALALADALPTPAQRAMVECHGTQCGFCTPGFVMALTALVEQAPALPLSERAAREGLCGNLCRCTGYVSILEAATSIQERGEWTLEERFAPPELREALQSSASDHLRVEDALGRAVWAPATVEEALRIKAAEPNATVVSGATDLAVRHNKGQLAPERVLCLTRPRDLEQAEVRDGVLLLGSRASWAAVERLAEDHVPEYARVLKLFGSPQIRAMGTVGGNFVNASPIADSLPFHYVMESRLVLASAQGARTLPIEAFYLGYKKLDLRPEELLLRVETPLPGPAERLRLFKVSRRKDLDISTFTAAIRLPLDAEWLICGARVALGGVGPTVLRLRGVEAMLEGQAPEEGLFREAGLVAREEITPITDVRGSADFRLQLAQNIFLKFFHEEFAVPETMIGV